MCCKLHSSFSGEFLEDIGAEVEQTINTNFYQCIYIIIRHLWSRDYHVTLPRVFGDGAFHTLSSLFTLGKSKKRKKLDQ